VNGKSGSAFALGWSSMWGASLVFLARREVSLDFFKRSSNCSSDGLLLGDGVGALDGMQEAGVPIWVRTFEL